MQSTLHRPPQVAFKQAAGNLDAIPDDSWAMKLATSLVPGASAALHLQLLCPPAFLLVDQTFGLSMAPPTPDC